MTMNENEFSKFIKTYVTLFTDDGFVIHGTVQENSEIFLTIIDDKTGKTTHIVKSKIKSIAEG